jgi:transposase
MDGSGAASGGRQLGETVKRTRRKWSAAQKARIVREALKPGAVVLTVARRHGVHPSLLVKWRNQQRSELPADSDEAANSARLLPVEVRGSVRPERSFRPRANAGASATKRGAIEVEFSSGPRLSIYGVVDAQMLRAVLQELSQS